MTAVILPSLVLLLCHTSLGNVFPPTVQDQPIMTVVRILNLLGIKCNDFIIYGALIPLAE